MTTIHHLDAGTMHPFLGRLLNHAGTLVDRVIAVVRDDGTVLLVDTGIGAAARAHPRRHLGGAAALFARADRVPGRAASAQLRALGLAPSSVTDIFVTHLDFDHAAGLPDFPAARVHVSAAELGAALAPRPNERARYIAANWSHGPDWAPFGEHAPRDELLGVPAHLDLGGTGIAALPLPGHTRGHTGYAIPVGDRWLVSAGDAFYAAGIVTGADVRRAVRTMELSFAVQPWRLAGNHARLRAIAARDDVVAVVCAHDPALIRPVTPRG